MSERADKVEREVLAHKLIAGAATGRTRRAAKKPIEKTVIIDASK